MSGSITDKYIGSGLVTVPETGGTDVLGKYKDSVIAPVTSKEETLLERTLLKRQQAQEASARNLANLERITGALRKQDEYNANTVVGRLGLDPEGIPATILNQVPRTIEFASGIPGAIVGAAADGSAQIQEDLVTSAQRAAFERVQNGQAQPGDQETLQERLFVPGGGGDMSAEERLTRAMESRQFANRARDFKLDGLSTVDRDGLKARSVPEIVKDGAVSLLGKGAAHAVDFGIGVANLIPAKGEGGWTDPKLGTAGKLLEEGAGPFRYRSEQLKAWMDTLYSDKQQAANEEVRAADAGKDGFDGFVAKLSSIGDNPSVIPHGIAESIGPMVVGAGIGRTVMPLAPGMTAGTAAAIGEGTVMAGSLAEGIRQETEDGLLTPKQAALAVAVAPLGFAAARLGGNLSQRLGVADVDTALVDGSIGKASRGALTRIPIAAGIEGAVEEMPQTAAETILQNTALDHDWNQGLGGAMAQGLVTGSAMGGGIATLQSAGESVAEAAQAEETKASVDQAFTEAATTGDVSALLQGNDPRTYRPDLAVNALREYSRTPDLAPELQEKAITDAQQIVAELENGIKLNQMYIDNATPEAQERAAQRIEQLTAELEAVDENDIDAINNLSARIHVTKQLASTTPEDVALRQEAIARHTEQLNVAQASIAMWNQQDSETADRSDVISVADSPAVEGVATPESVEAISKVMTLAMNSPERITTEQATQLADNTSNSLTEPQRLVLRTLAQSRIAENRFKGLDGVRQEVLVGNTRTGNKGLKTYQASVAKALASNNQKLAYQQLTGLRRFAQGHSRKAEVAGNAYERVLEEGGEVYLVAGKGGVWTESATAPTEEQRQNNGGMTIHVNSEQLVQATQEEANLLTTGLAALESAYNMKFQPETNEAVTQPTSTEPVAQSEAVEAPQVPPVSEAVATEASAPVIEAEGVVATAEPVPSAIQGVTEQTDGVVDAESGSTTGQSEGDVNSRFRAENLVRAHMVQDSGNPLTGTTRPLVAEQDFLSRTGQGEIDPLQYLNTEELTEDQMGVYSTFLRKAREWAPLIQENFAKRDNPAFNYQDYTQYLLDEQGNVDENTLTAISVAAFQGLLDIAGNGLYNSDSAINSILHRSSDTPVPYSASRLLGTVGTREGVVSNSLGQKAAQVLGWKAKPGSPKNVQAMLEASLGAHVLGLLKDLGAVERVTLTGAQMEEFRDNSADGTLPPKVRAAQAQKRAKQLHHFIRPVVKGDLKHENLHELIQEVQTASKGTSGFMDKMFSIENAPKEPSLTPITYDQVKANKSDKAVSSVQRKALTKEAKAPHKVFDDMLAVFEKLDESTIEQIAGIQEVSADDMHLSNRRGAEAKNNGLRRELDHLHEFLGTLGRTKNGVAQRFYLMPVAWLNDRVGLDSKINPQTSKIHRFLLGKASATTTVRWSDTDQTNLDVFKLRVAEGIGIGSDKQTNAAALDQYAKTVQKPVYRDAVEALKDLLADADTTTEHQEAILQGVKAGKAGFHTLSALVAQAQYEMADTAGTKTFSTNILAEVDGVANGPILARLLFGAFDSVEGAFETLTRGGFFRKDSGTSNYNHWRTTPGNSDLYESFAIALGKRIGASGGDRRALQALYYITGALYKDGSPTKVGRNIAKPPVTKLGFGESVTKTVDTMAEEFVQSFYNDIQEIHQGKSEKDLKKVLTAAHLLINTQNPNALGDLNVGMSSAEALELIFNKAQTSALKGAYKDLLGNAVEETAKDLYSVFLKRRNAFNQAAGLSFSLYNAVYQAKRQAKLDELVANNEIAYNPKTKQPLEDLRPEQEAEIRSSIAGFAPRLHSAMSKESGEIDAALVLAKHGRTMSRDLAYTNQVKFSKDTGKGKTATVHGYKATQESPGVSGGVIATHSFDAAVSINAGEQVDSTNVHDARLYGVKNVHVGARSLNLQTYQQALHYSPFDELVQSLEQTIKGVSAAAQEDSSLAGDLAAIEQELKGRMNKEQKKAIATQNISAVEYVLNELRSNAKDARTIQLSVLADTQAVDQYAFEGGEYQVTQADRDQAQQLLTDYNQAVTDFSVNASAKQLAQLANRKPATETAETVDALMQEPVEEGTDQVGYDEPVQPQETEAAALVPVGPKSTPWGLLGASPFRQDDGLVSFFERNKNLTAKQLIDRLRRDMATRKGNRTADFYSKLLLQVSKVVDPAMPIHYLTATSNNEGVEGTDVTNSFGWFNVNAQGNASINIKSPDYVTGSVTPELMIHELVHAAVAQLIQVELAKKKNNPGYDSETLQRVQELEAMRQELLGSLSAEQQEQFSEPLSNVQEFVAWGMTNTRFQQVLAAHTYESAQPGLVGTLTNAAQKFVDTITRILFRGSSKTVQEQSVTQLSVLMAHTAGLMQEAQQRQEVTNGLTLRQQAPGIQQAIADMTPAQVFDALGTLSKPINDVSFRDHLRGVVGNLTERLGGPFGSYMDTLKAHQAKTPNDVYMKSLELGILSHGADAHFSGFDMGEQEVFALEMVQEVVEEALSDTTVLPYAKLQKLYNEARDRIKPTDMHTDADKGQQLWNYVFKPQLKGETSTHLSRFAALGLTHAPFSRLLGFNTASNTEQRSTTVFGRLLDMLNEVLNLFNERLGNVYGGQQADEKLTQLVERLVDIGAKRRLKLEDESFSLSDKVDHYTGDITEKAKAKIEAFGDSDFFQRNKSGYLKAFGSVTSMIAGDRVDQFTDAFKKLYDEHTEGKAGFFAHMYSEMQTTHDGNVVGRTLLRLTKRLENIRKDIRTDVGRLAKDSFIAGGREMSDADIRGVTNAFLRTGAYALEGTYSLSEILELIQDPAARKAAIATQRSKLPGRHAIYYRNQAEALGYFMATGKVGNDHLHFNAESIAYKHGTKDAASLAGMSLTRSIEAIDVLASLEALNFTAQSDLTAAAKVLEAELARTDGNGVAFVMALHKQQIDHARNTVFKGSENLMMKGYLPEVHNPYREVKVIGEDEINEYMAKGWKVKGQAQSDQHDPSKQRQYVAVVDLGMRGRMTGVFSNTGMRNKGSESSVSYVTDANGERSYQGSRVTEHLNKKKAASREAIGTAGYRLNKDHASMAPIYNRDGDVTGYRYMMINETRDALLQRSNDFGDLLGTLASTTFDKESSEVQNKKAVDALREQWQGDYKNNPRSYMLVSETSQDKEISEAYRLLPRETRRYIEKVWGTQGMMVRRDQLDLFFGYRKYSLSDAFAKEQKNFAEKALVFVLSDVMGLGEKAALRLSQVEDVWQAVVAETKDILVVKTGFTLYWNIVSNFTLLWLSGVNPVKMFQHHKVAIRGALAWRRDTAELTRLESMKATGMIVGTPTDLDSRIVELKDSMARNPVREFIEAGMLPTIVEDLEANDNPYSYKSRLVDSTERVTKHIPAPVKTVGKYLYMTHDTPLYKLLSQGTQLSDFVAKYTLYQHLSTRKVNPLSQADALNRASDAFVNYDIPTHRGLQYANDVGLVFFTRYYIRIQKIIMQTMTDNPLRTVLLLALDSYLGGMQTILDSGVVNQIGNPLDIGAFKFFDSLDELATVQGMSALLK